MHPLHYTLYHINMAPIQQRWITAERAARYRLHEEILKKQKDTEGGEKTKKLEKTKASSTHRRHKQKKKK